MIMKVDTITVLLLASSLVSILGAYAAWRQRRKPSAISMSLLSLCAGIWSLFYLLEYLSPDLQTKLFWAAAKFPAVAFLPIALATFVLRFAGWQDWPGKGTLISLSIFPVLTNIVIFTNSYHHLFWKSYELEQYQGFVGLQTTFGLWFLFHVVYSYGIIVVSSIVALSSLTRTWHTHSRQTLFLITGLSIPLAGNLLSVFKIHPWSGLDLSPITFGIGTIFLLATTQLVGILDVIPLAHTALLEQLRDGLMVLNNQEVIMEINTAAEKIIGIPRQSVLGRNIKEFDHLAIKMLQQESNGDTVRHEIQLGEQDNLRWYDTRISAIFTKSGFVAGRMIVWHEITDRKQIEDRLRHASTHDQLTSLYNRMYFDEIFDHITRTESWPVAILMLDMDNLKKTNDKYGHAVGDKLLCHAAKVLRSTFRQDDVVARIGGDEFAIIVPRCDKNNLEKLVTRLREAITQPLDLLPATKLEFSVGYALANNIEELQSAKNLADQKMYADKNRRK